MRTSGMPELQGFLRDAWEATEREKTKAEIAAANALLDERIAELRHQITAEGAALATSWGLVKLAFLALAGLALLVFFVTAMANTHDSSITRAVGALGVLLLIVPAWGGIVLAPCLVVWVLVVLIITRVTVASLEEQIRSAQAEKR